MSTKDDDALVIIGEGWPISFRPSACKGCNAHCCRGEPGAVWVGQDDIERIAGLLGISVPVARQRYVRQLSDGDALIEVELAIDDFPCIFLDLETHRCGIYEARPAQCRTFPFWDYFKKHPMEAADECPGVELCQGEN